MKIIVKVTPNARKNEIIEESTDLLGTHCMKIKVNQPPEDGKANNAVLELIAQHFGVRKSQVRIIKGEASRTKVVEVIV